MLAAAKRKNDAFNAHFFLLLMVGIWLWSRLQFFDGQQFFMLKLQHCIFQENIRLSKNAAKSDILMYAS